MIWRKKDCVRIVCGFVPRRMRVGWFIVNTYNVPCTGIVSHARSSNYTTLKTALFDGNFDPKRCGTVIPHRDFSGWLV